MYIYIFIAGWRDLGQVGRELVEVDPAGAATFRFDACRSFAREQNPGLKGALRRGFERLYSSGLLIRVCSHKVKSKNNWPSPKHQTLPSWDKHPCCVNLMQKPNNANMTSRNPKPKYPSKLNPADSTDSQSRACERRIEYPRERRDDRLDIHASASGLLLHVYVYIYISVNVHYMYIYIYVYVYVYVWAAENGMGSQIRKGATAYGLWVQDSGFRIGFRGF